VKNEKKTFKIWVWGFWWTTSGLGYVLRFCIFFYDVITGTMS